MIKIILMCDTKVLLYFEKYNFTQLFPGPILKYFYINDRFHLIFSMQLFLNFTKVILKCSQAVFYKNLVLYHEPGFFLLNIIFLE